MDCKDDLQTEVCTICNRGHSRDPSYPSIEVEDYCPMVLELNMRLAEACLAQDQYPDQAPLVETPPLASYADYLFRKAYFSDKPLRPDEQDKLDKLLKKKDMSFLLKRGWKKRRTKMTKYEERERLRRLDMGYRYDYLLDVWKMANIPVELTKEEFVSDVMGEFMISYVYPWMGTIAEYIRDERDGGRGGSIRLERLDTSLPLQLGNVQVRENIPKEMRRERKATVEVVDRV